MKINLVSDSTNSPDQQKIVYWLASQMAKDYHISPKHIMHFVNEGSEDLCAWIKKTYNVKVTGFVFRDEIRTYGAGFEFEDGPNLTALLLKIPSGKLDLGR